MILPKNALIVITGPSGSGKSSLALDTLFAEGQRRYVESLSTYARQFLGVNKKPDVEKIEGLCPAIAIEQKTTGFNPRSTVGTTTEIYDYLRVLFARLGVPHCPKCNKQLTIHTPEEVANSLLQKYHERTLAIGAEIAVQRKGEFKNLLKDFFSKGYSSFFIDNQIYKFTSLQKLEDLRLAKNIKHTIFLILDRLTVKPENKDYLFLAVKKAFSFSQGSCAVIFPEKRNNQIETYTSNRICLDCVTSFPTIDPRMLSFNSPIGACSDCHGLGVKFVWTTPFYKHARSQNPLGFLGDEDEDIQEDDGAGDGGYRTCGACQGARLNKEALALKISEQNIFQLCQMSLKNLKRFIDELKFDGNEQKISHRLLFEISTRIGFLLDVGLDYLSLARTASTLSGGESQRIRLATQIGTSLAGVLYILDEPSIGLHQRDNDRLIATLKKLRDLGNTVVVVEHDLDTMLAADYLVDMGPGAGIHGGYVVAAGDVTSVSLHPDSITGPYISGKKSISVPKVRRQPTGFLGLSGLTKNNLKDVNVQIPLGILVAVTGVSGSGKSSLVSQSLVPAMRSFFHIGHAVADGVGNVSGLSQIRNMVFVDQKPIGRTPRSNPATYLGIFNDIRSIFSRLPETRLPLS